MKENIKDQIRRVEMEISYVEYLIDRIIEQLRKL